MTACKCDAYQQFVKILDIVGFEEGEVSWGLVIHLFRGAVLCLHVETRHTSNRCGSGRQLTGWSTDWHVACWWRQNLQGEKKKMSWLWILWNNVYLWLLPLENEQDTDLVSLWEHGIKLLVCERPVPLINFPLPPPCLQLLWSHAHQMAWRKQRRNRDFDTVIKWVGAGIQVTDKVSWMSISGCFFWSIKTCI